MAGLTRKQFEERSEEATRLADRLVFLRDAFDGSGGFAPMPPSQTTSTSGAVANIPAWASTNYLVRHEGENWKPFQTRRLLARYVNHVRRAIQHFVGLLTKRPPTRSKPSHEALQLLLTNCDGCGTTIDGMRETLATQACIFPGVPWTVDRPFDAEARTAAENKGPPRLRLRLPETVRDWRMDAQRNYDWLKIVEELAEKGGPAEKERRYYRATVWYRDRFEVWTMDRGGGNPPSLGNNRWKNKLGVVPAGVFTFADSVGSGGDLFGWSPGGELADLAFQDFNDLSRLTDFLARGTFPMFLVPVEEGDEEEVQELEVGTMTAYGYPKDASRAPAWATQDAHPIDSHNKRREINEAEGLRAMGMESLAKSTNVPASGLAKQYDNEHLDGSLRRLGQRIDRWELQIARLWLLWWGEPPEVADRILADYSVKSPDSYGIEDIDSLITQADGVLRLPGVDPYTHRGIIIRVSDAIARLSDDEKDERNKWLEAQVQAQAIGESDDENRTAVPAEDGKPDEGTAEPGQPQEDDRAPGDDAEPQQAPAATK